MRSMEVKKLDTDTERDRLSDLPDDLLCHIISLLPIKDTVRTSILSTRWKSLYTLVPNLNFEADSLPRKDFMNIVDRVLFARKRIDVDKFSLTCGKVTDFLGVFDHSRVEGWVQYALWHNVRELDLNFEPMLIRVPTGIFTCKTLVSLKLTMYNDGLFELRIPCNVFLPSLKILHLHEFVFFDDSAERLVSSCSALEELVLEACFYKNITRFNVSNSSLKRLTISHSYIYAFLKEVQINAPSLVYFKYDHLISKSHLLVDLHSLVEAYIDLGCVASADLIRGLRHVQSLHLSGAFSGDLLLGHDSIPIMENMTKLRIGMLYPEDWERLLNFAPCLETLVFEEIPYCEEYILNSPKEVPPCLISRMKAIKFLLFRGKQSEMQMVEYFLKHGEVLESLVIQMNASKDLQLKITEKLLKFPIVSAKCRVVIV